MAFPNVWALFRSKTEAESRLSFTKNYLKNNILLNAFWSDYFYTFADFGCIAVETHQ